MLLCYLLWFKFRYRDSYNSIPRFQNCSGERIMQDMHDTRRQGKWENAISCFIIHVERCPNIKYFAHAYSNLATVNFPKQTETSRRHPHYVIGCLCLRKYYLPCAFKITMMTLWNGNVFRVTGHLCVEFTDHRWIPCRCSWSIACRRCSNYIFILNLTPGFNGLGKDN